jgi:hypothetical protein
MTISDVPVAPSVSAVIVTGPLPDAWTSPVAETVAMLGSLETHRISR